MVPFNMMYLNMSPYPSSKKKPKEQKPTKPWKVAFEGWHRFRVINHTATVGESLRVSPASNWIKWLNKSDGLQLITLKVTTPTSFLLLSAFGKKKKPNEQIWNRFKWKIGLSLLIKSTSRWFMDLCYRADLRGGSAHSIPTRRCNSPCNSIAAVSEARRSAVSVSPRKPPRHSFHGTLVHDVRPGRVQGCWCIRASKFVPN